MFESGRLHLHNDIRNGTHYLLLILQTKLAVYLLRGTPGADSFDVVWGGDLVEGSEVVPKDVWDWAVIAFEPGRCGNLIFGGLHGVSNPGSCS